MNAVRELIQSFIKKIDRLLGAIGRFGSSRPVDDSKSGINIDGKIYNVVVSLNGCYWYLDEDGKKQAVAKIPETTPWEWVNIAEKDSRDLRACYQTAGGRVEIFSWFLFNDQIGELKETHYVTNSSDVMYPIGMKMSSIPDEWVMVDCDFTDAEERHIYHINRCYYTVGGDVQISGYQIVDSFEKVYETEVSIVNSNNPDYSVGETLNVIPEEWILTDCRFASKTQRHANAIYACYENNLGKVYVEGHEIMDNRLNVESMRVVVLESTIEEIPVDTVWNGIPDGFKKVSCNCNCCHR